MSTQIRRRCRSAPPGRGTTPTGSSSSAASSRASGSRSSTPKRSGCSARTDLIDTDNIRCRWQNHVETGECRFDCFDPVIDLSEACERAARDPRLLEIVGALYGEPACLFKDKLIFKPPGSPGYELHQDYISWKSFPTTLPHGHRRHRRGRREQRRDRSVPRLSHAGLPDAAGRQLPPAPGRRGRSVEGRVARPRAGRRGDLQRLHAASLGAEPLGAAAAAALSELQRAQRRRRAARPALRRVPHAGSRIATPSTARRRRSSDDAERDGAGARSRRASNRRWAAGSTSSWRR